MVKKAFRWSIALTYLSVFAVLSFQFIPILLVISTNSMLLLDQKTMQIKYRIPASEIYRMSLSPYFDDIAVIHIRAVSDVVIGCVQWFGLFIEPHAHRTRLKMFHSFFVCLVGRPRCLIDLVFSFILLQIFRFVCGILPSPPCRYHAPHVCHYMYVCSPMHIRLASSSPP